MAKKKDKIECIPFPKGEKIPSLFIWALVEHTWKVIVFFSIQIILISLFIAFLTLDIHRQIDKRGEVRIVWGKKASDMNFNYGKNK